MHSKNTACTFVSQSAANKDCFNLKPRKMKHIITLVATLFIVAVSFADVKPYKTSLKIKSENTSLKVLLQAAGKVCIFWTAVEESTTTLYKIQKSVNGAEFKTMALLMGESNPSYTFKDKLNGVSGTIEYRVVTTDNSVVVSTSSQNVVIF